MSTRGSAVSRQTHSRGQGHKEGPLLQPHRPNQQEQEGARHGDAGGAEEALWVGGPHHIRKGGGGCGSSWGSTT